MIKLSDIWDKADKELTQIKHKFGSPVTMYTCALGAIVFYLSNRKSCNPTELNHEEYFLFSRLTSEFYKNNIIPNHTKLSITELNDKMGWTFKQFADKARELGL